MMPEGIDRARELLRRAGGLDAQARLGYLREQCGSDEELSAEVERLLDSQEPATLADPIHSSPEAPERSAFLRREISHYRLVGELGRGGMGVVYRAVDVRLNRTVAIKFLPWEAVGDSIRNQRIIQEAQTASSLNHPNIVTIHEIDRVDGASYIVMEYVRGVTLAERIRHPDFGLDEALSIAIQVADAVGAAHEAGIVHRDLKPANIMVAETGVVKLLDFGLAKSSNPAAAAASAMQSLTGDQNIVGTISYMSPEQTQGKKLDARSDIFSFGVVLFEMLTRRHPFAGDSIAAILMAIAEKNAPAPSEIDARIPQQMDAVVGACLQKNPAHRPRQIAEVKAALEALRAPPSSTSVQFARRTRRKRFKAAAAVVLLAVVAAAAAWWWAARPASETAKAPVLVRLTTDPGLSTFPAISPDGKFICYSSDRGGKNLDLWLQQIGGGEPVRVSSDEADESGAAFSPDGARIAFRSDQRGGGIYVVPALGGDAELIASGGRGPRFSRDGKAILYWVGELGSGFVAGSARMFMVPIAGGRPEAVRAEFAAAASPIWMPDGKQLLFLGRLNGEHPASETLDWWLAPVQGGQAVRTGALTLFRARGLSPPAGMQALFPSAIAADGAHIVFSARQGDATNVWQIPISPRTGKVAGEPERLTSGTGDDVYPAAAPGMVAFSSEDVDVNVWTLPVHPDSGRAAGAIRQLTDRVAFEGYPSVSADGTKMTYVLARSGHWEVWLKQLDSGREHRLTHATVPQFQPKITSDGSRVAYWQVDGDRGATYIVDTGGGVPEKLCEPCGPPTHVAPDGRKILLETYGRLPRALYLLDIESRRQMVLLQAKQRTDSIPYAARFSPDGHWVVFHLTTRTSGMRRIFIAPLGAGNGPIQENEWIPITGEGRNLEAYWSGDGKLLYFLSDRDGFRCIWAQKLDAVTKRPAGPPFAIQHFHNASRSIAGVGGSAGAVGLSAARDRLYFALAEVKGNIWSLTTEAHK